MPKSLKHKMPEQTPQDRRNNFNEVALGYDETTARAEADRCLQCANPFCRQGCPVNVNIPAFIKHIKNGDFEEAISEIKTKNSLPAVCGRVCPQENQCEKFCILGKKNEPVAIGRLERFAADYARGNKKKSESSAQDKTMGEQIGKVAVIGSGPAGLTVAGDLALLGYKVTVFEALHAAGGVLMYGIPEFRLPKDIVQHEINELRNLGVDIAVNSIIGRTFTIDELLNEQGYDAVFIGTGAGLPNFLNIPGENYNGVYAANEFLTRSNLMQAYKKNATTPIYKGDKVAVIGAGNVAMDAARTALRLGASNVYIVYRRSEQEMPARAEEIHHAREEGVEFKLLTNPVRILGNEKGWVEGLECVKMELGEADLSGRRKPVEVKNSNFVLEVDSVIIAIGQGPNPLIQYTTPGLEVNKHGNINTDEQGITSKPGVFAGGDIVTGAATVISAMGAGRKAAESIHKYIQDKKKID